MEKANPETVQKYIWLISQIDNLQARLKWSELAFTVLNLSIFFPTLFFIAYVSDKIKSGPDPMIAVLMLFCTVIGIFINTFWTASSMRLQLKLKLRYFQARFLERRMDVAGEYFISEEADFFDPKSGEIHSPDNEEVLLYPKEGLLRMDGFIGSAKPRIFSIFMPLLFFVIYIVSFVVILSNLI